MDRVAAKTNHTSIKKLLKPTTGRCLLHWEVVFIFLTERMHRPCNPTKVEWYFDINSYNVHDIYHAS